jgi:NAD+ synthase (glutamine-hydrolysing)
MRGNIPLVYINAVGANDQIVFDGRSFVISPLAEAAKTAASKDYPVTLSAKAFE